MCRWLAIGIILAVTASGCGGNSEPVIDPEDGGDYRVELEAMDFVARVDNPWLPLVPGSRWTYEAESEDGVERIEVVVTDEVRLIQGVSATVVRDTVTLDGRLIEDTFDWFAQDVDGNVWYLGEDSSEYDEGTAVSKAGSWEWGVDGALPGIVMPTDPSVGMAYRQEYYAGEAEDMAEVVGRGESVSVPFADYEDALVIREWNPLEPNVVEEKVYASGVGVVLERQVEGGSEVVELVDFSTGATA